MTKLKNARFVFAVVLAIAAAATATACDEKSSVPPAAAAEAKSIYESRCQSCHGPNGAGDGPAAATLDPKPRKYNDASWQKSVTDQQVADIIVKGGVGVGKSQLMPPNPDLKDKKDVVNGLVALIRSFGK